MGGPDESFQLSVSIFVTDQQLSQAIASAFTDDQAISPVKVISTEQSATFEAFDDAFYVGVSLSFPIGIATGIIVNWLQKKLDRSRAAAGSPPIKVQIESVTISIPANTAVDYERIHKAITAARQSCMPSDATRGAVMR